MSAALDSAREDDVRLHDVDSAADDQVAGRRDGANHLSGRDAKPVAAQCGIAFEIVRRQRLLEPVDVQSLELVGELRGGAPIPARSHVSGHAPALVRVHHDLEVAANSVPHGRDDRKVESPVG